MATNEQVVEAEIRGTEKAIRLLISHENAEEGTLHRENAVLKLLEAKHNPKPTKPWIGPSGSRFPDVSSYQPNVNLEAVRHASEIHVGSFMVTKLTEGIGIVDAYGPRRVVEIAAAGMAVGAYHFGHPSENPIEQAEKFLLAWHTYGHEPTANDVAIYDCEVTDGESGNTVAQCAKEFGDHLRGNFPGRLWLYGGGPFLTEYGVALEPFHAHWLAAYVNDPAPYMCYGRERTVAWQYTDSEYGPTPHACPGIGSCDMSIVLL